MKRKIYSSMLLSKIVAKIQYKNISKLNPVKLIHHDQYEVILGMQG